MTSATPSGTQGTVDEAAFRAGLEQAVAELMAAIGNPDTGAPSDASGAFDAALAAGDPPRITTTAAAVVAHLDAARTAIAAVAGWPPGATQAAEWTLLLDHLAAGTVAMRDGGIGKEAKAVEAARASIGEALQDHFWPAVRGPEAMTQMLQVLMPDGRSATASRGRYPGGVDKAFDGNPDTAWIAGDVPAPQWIEVDLGWEASITGVRLLTAQDVPGATDHVVTVRNAAGEERELTRFTGTTRDAQWLEHTAAAPVSGVKVVRVTTLQSPAMIGWREIEVLVAPGASPSSCPAGGDEVATGASTTGEPSLAGREPGAAVDGNEATGWDPGDTRGPGDVRGWLQVLLPRPVLVSEVRLLLGGPAGPAAYEVTGWTTDGRGLTLGKVEGTAGPAWIVVPGATPCTAMTSIMIGVTSAGPAPQVREVSVRGTAAP